MRDNNDGLHLQPTTVYGLTKQADTRQLYQGGSLSSGFDTLIVKQEITWIALNSFGSQICVLLPNERDGLMSSSYARRMNGVDVLKTSQGWSNAKWWVRMRARRRSE